MIWTNRKKEEADVALVIVEKLINKFGMQLIIEALIQQNSIVIAREMAFGANSDYLEILEVNLKVALKEYQGRHNKFGKCAGVV